MKRTYQTIHFISLAFFLDLVILIVIVEYIRHTGSPLGAMVGFSRLDAIRILFYLLAVLPYFWIKNIRQSLLHTSNPVDEITAWTKLKWVALVPVGLCEWGAILGLVWFLMSGNRLDFYVMTTISAVGMSLMIPRAHEWDEWMKNMRGMLCK